VKVEETRLKVGLKIVGYWRKWRGLAIFSPGSLPA